MDVSNKIMQDGKQVKLNASEIMLKNTESSESVEKFANNTTQIIRVDTLSSPMQITATEFANPDIIPMTARYETGSIFLIEFGTTSADGRNNAGCIIYGTNNNSAGHTIVGTTGNDILLVSNCRNPGNLNSIGFYNARRLSGSAENLYVYSIHLIKPKHP